MKKIILSRAALSPVSEEPRFLIRYEDELNPAQYEAAVHRDGPALVIAGAGTGKTRTLTYRVARLIETGIPAPSILLLTFTRKAAQEMLRRAAMLLDQRTEYVDGGTFHSFANKVLRKHAPEVGYDAGFTILDQGDSEDVINMLRTKAGFATKNKRFPRKDTLHRMFSMSVNTLTPLDQIVLREYPHFMEHVEEMEALARAYVSYKKAHAVMDYDDLLVGLVTLLEAHPSTRATLSRLWRYIMVDEYQDTNALQARIIQLLAGEHRNVMVVGDDSQSIYSFRGANFRNIMEFPALFPDCRVITLEQNFRSTQPILDLTNEVIRLAAEKYEKHLFTRRNEGELPARVIMRDENTQSRFVVHQVLELREEGVALSDMAVLFRAGFHSFDLEIELNKANIPFRKFGGLKLMETAHVKDVIAHLRVLSNPRDVVSWTRILLLLDGVGPKSAERITDEIAMGLDPFLSTSMERLGSLVRGNAVRELLSMLAPLRKDSLGVADRVGAVTLWIEPILKERYDDHPRRMKDVDMLVVMAERYSTLDAYLSDLALEPPTESVTDIEDGGGENEFLTLSTVHSAKGLEWHSVFLLHLLEGRFPMSSATESLSSMEEERRLFYVACTRAKRRLFLCTPETMFDRMWGTVLSKASRFVEELSEDLVEAVSVE